MPEPRYRYVVEVKGPSNRALVQVKTDDAEEAVNHFLQILEDAEQAGAVMPFHAERLKTLALIAFASGQTGVSFILGSDVVGFTRTTN